jgi:hypothetical protein
MILTAVDDIGRYAKLLHHRRPNGYTYGYTSYRGAENHHTALLRQVFNLLNKSRDCANII